jgi:hypothetical protein
MGARSVSILYVDFETRSRCDLPAQGVYNYAMDGSTDVLCMSWAFDDDEVQTWVPGQDFPVEVEMHRGQIRAHNAAFERLIFKYVLEQDFALGAVLLHRSAGSGQLCAWVA